MWAQPTLFFFSHYGVALQNDLLMWLMKDAKGVERSVEGLARRLLAINFAAIHTTSQASDNTHSLQVNLDRCIIGAHASSVSSPPPS